jgi:hypothetical protein
VVKDAGRLSQREHSNREELLSIYFFVRGNSVISHLARFCANRIRCSGNDFSQRFLTKEEGFSERDLYSRGLAVCLVVGNPLIGKQLSELGNRLAHNPTEHVVEILPRVDTARLARLNQPEVESCCTGASVAGSKQLVLPFMRSSA